ncbi:MAG: YbjN domain-containing protein [Propionibacteriaceae bacterium]|nr:YbjN domain-containing protein [Propionibacteriaceae bacterium]
MADIEDFDLDTTTLRAWDDFSERLAEVLSVMDATSDLSISVVASRAQLEEPPVIRFSFVEPETVVATLLGADVPGLADIGWQPVGDGTFRVQHEQEDTVPLAALVTRTMTEALGAIHPVFLEPDQLADILKPAAPAEPHIGAPPGAFGVVMPTTREQLDAIVDAEVGSMFGHPPLRDGQGDVALRVGSTMVFLRSTPDFQELVLFAVLVHDVAGRSRACEVLNDLNTESRYCRFALHRDRVFVQVSVPTRPFVPAHLRQALANISQMADGIDDELAHRLRGRTTFG